MNYFCTLFDSFYLDRGLVMHQSLARHCASFHLFIFAFDELSLNILKSSNLQNVTVISLKEFENDQLLAVKPGRSKGEYCWTCTPLTIEYCINVFNLPHCTYIDADLCFYSDPSVLVQEMGNNSVLITEHRYTPKYDQSEKSGFFCVQFICFKNDEAGRRALEWWRERCIEWCFARFENGKFGDQKYLDDWPVRFPAVHVLQHLGGGVAPWNVQQYKLDNSDQRWVLTDRQTSESFPLVFFHFHYVKFYSDGKVSFSDIYDLGYKSVLVLYKDYLLKLKGQHKFLLEKFNFVPPVTQAPQRSTLYRFARNIYNRMQRLSGIYKNMDMEDWLK